MKIKFIIVAVVALGIGFLGGMEYKAYQIRSAFTGAFSEAFGEDKTTSKQEVETPKPEEKAQPVNDLNNNVGFEITDKDFMKSNYQEYNTFSFNLTNKTDKDITGVKGILELKDLFGDNIKTTRLSYDEGIKAGETKVYKVTIDYNQFMDEDMKLKSTDLDKMKCTFDVSTIIYSDGTQEGS